MRIGLRNIDSRIAQAVEQRLLTPLHCFLSHEIAWSPAFHSEFQRTPTPDEIATYVLKRKSSRIGIGGVMLVTGVSFILFWIGLISAFLLGQHNGEAGLAIFGGIWLGGTGLTLWRSLGKSSRKRLKRCITIEELRAVHRFLALTETENTYYEAVLQLASPHVRKLSPRAMQETLRQLNTLLGQGRQLENARMSLLQLSSSHNMLNLAAEYDALHRRLDETYDPLARQSRERSLQMCASRLENARTFSDALERVEAQQEAILQTLSSALSSLGRMQMVPESPGESHELAQAVTEITQQTYEVDKAVAEILTHSTH